jgi:hypothetical protein
MVERFDLPVVVKAKEAVHNLAFGASIGEQLMGVKGLTGSDNRKAFD